MPIQIADAYRNSAFAQRQTGLLFNLPAPDPDHEQLPEGVSLCMIVKNEERFLAECLESITGVVDEINIVDTGSTDRTVEIARSYGANVIFREWRSDFAWARNEALAMATKRWTLVLDADEELERESVGLVRSLRTTPASFAAVYINIVNIVSDAAGMGTMSHRLIRIFPTNPVLRFGGAIHESLMRTDDAELSAVLSPIAIVHKGYTHEILAAREKDARNKPLIERAYEEHGDDSFALFNYGNSAICSGNTELGIEVLERMLATAQEIKLYFPLVYLLLGQAYCESLGEHQKAIDILDTGLNTFPKDAGLIFTKGQVLIKLNQVAEARELFEEALSLREHMAYSVMTDEEIFEWKVFYALAGTYEREKNFEKAIECIDKALANKPTAFHLQRAKAAFLESEGRFYDAEIAFRRIAEVDNQRGQLELVNYLLRRSRFAQAIAIVENEIDPESNGDLVAMLSVSAARASLQSRRGDPIPFLETALRRAPGNGPAIALMEQLLTERGDASGLERLHREELLAPCKFPEDFGRRSFRLLALGRFDEALAAADAGLQLDPRNAELRFNLALAALRLGDEKRAVQEFSRVEPGTPLVFAAAMRMRALLLSKHGDRAGVLTAVQARIATFPADVDAIVESARILVEAGARSDAVAILEANAELDSRVALELTRLLLQDIAGAGRVPSAALK
jgi:tetratricopeptide (TPR) repeat protein